MRFKGRPVVDGEHELVWTVDGRRDVVTGEERSPHRCFAARGLQRMEGIIDGYVGTGVAYVEHAEEPDVWRRYVLPAELKGKVATFDRDGGNRKAAAAYLHGQTLRLLPPPERERLGARAGERPGSNVRKGQAESINRAQPLRHILEAPEGPTVRTQR